MLKFYFYRIVKANGGSPPLTYQKFNSILVKIGAPEAAVAAPQQIPAQCKTSVSEDLYRVPALEELAVDLTGLGEEKYPGGETEALARMEKYMNKQVLHHAPPPIFASTRWII